MKINFLHAATLVCALGAANFVTAALSQELVNPAELCAANPNCEQRSVDTSGTTLFRLRKGYNVVSVRCSADGTCQKMYPKRGGDAIAGKALTLFFIAE